MDTDKHGLGLCPACARPINPAFEAGALDYSLKKRFIISVCRGCGHGMTQTLDETGLEGLYTGGSYDVKEAVLHRVSAPLLRTLEKRKLRYLGGVSSGARLLEIGCGKGRFLEAAKEAGFDVRGVEPSERSYAFARARLGDIVANIGIDDIVKRDGFRGPYGAVVMWHVLEHLKYPERALKAVSGLIDGEGKLLIAVPNFGSLQAVLGKGCWYHLDPPRHLHHFTLQSIEMVLENNGFYLVDAYFDSFYQNYIGEIVTLTNCLMQDKNVFFNVIKRNPYYTGEVGKTRAAAMFGASLVVAATAALPLLAWTFITQIIRRAGTIVLIAAPKILDKKA